MFQFTGSFKFRAAFHLAAHVPRQKLITASSGNFGQALACACQWLGKQCTVVMPDTSARVKIQAVREYGATVDLIDVRRVPRQTRVRKLARFNPEAYVASAYDDPLVIEGNASLGRELAQLPEDCEAVFAPIGGGGLTAGILQGLKQAGRCLPVIAAEPLLANDAAQSWRAGSIVALEDEPDTIADGARTLSVGNHNWPILRNHLSRIIEVPEEKIKEALGLLFELANVKAEPTGALALGALLTEPESFHRRTVCCVVSGGNVDPTLFAALLTR
jgi:threonine dehydratase